MKKRFTEAQIIRFSEASYYLWRSKFGGMSVSDAKRLKELETENGRLKKLLAESQLKIEVTREVLQKMVTAPVRREVVREMVARGPSERRALSVGRMSASAFRYVPRPDGNAVVRDRIVDLAQRHRRYGAGMIYLKLRQAGHVINHKRSGARRQRDRAGSLKNREHLLNHVDHGRAQGDREDPDGGGRGIVVVGLADELEAVRGCRTEFFFHGVKPFGAQHNVLVCRISLTRCALHDHHGFAAFLEDTGKSIALAPAGWRAIGETDTAGRGRS